MKKSILLFTYLLLLALRLTAQNCNTKGIIIQGVECKLIFANNTIMHACEAPPEVFALNVGDSLYFAFEPSGCVSFCQQGMDIKVTCYEPFGGGGCIPTDWGVLIQGNSPACHLLKLFNGTVFNVCNAPQGFEILTLGDTVGVKYQITNCFTPCNEAQPAEITCFNALKGVQAYFTSAMGNASFLFMDQSQADSIHTWSWSFGDGSPDSNEQNATHYYANPGWYQVCLTITGLDAQQQLLSDTYCDQIYVTDGCVDSSQICLPGSLCCDAPLFMPVCGCNGVTYDNACIAALFGGVLQSTPGACASSTLSPLFFQSAQLQPNPASETTTLFTQLPQSVDVSLHLTNLLGQTVLPAQQVKLLAGEQHTPLDISALPAGVYLLILHAGDTVVAKKLVVNR